MDTLVPFFPETQFPKSRSTSSCASAECEIARVMGTAQINVLFRSPSADHRAALGILGLETDVPSSS